MAREVRLLNKTLRSRDFLAHLITLVIRHPSLLLRWLHGLLVGLLVSLPHLRLVAINLFAHVFLHLPLLLLMLYLVSRVLLTLQQSLIEAVEALFEAQYLLSVVV